MAEKSRQKLNRKNISDYNLKVYKEFRRSLKHIVFDETLTLYIFRPIAFIFVKMLYRTNVTPNQISFASILVGILAGIMFAHGTYTYFIVGGLLYTFSIVLDCVDGMIARLKKNGTAIGRLIDGVADYLVGIAVYVGMALGLEEAGVHLPLNTWLVFCVAAVSHIFHVMIVDYYRVEFMAHALGKIESPWEERQKFTAELNRIRFEKGKWLEKIVISIYIGYSHLQLFRSPKHETYDSKKYYQGNKLLIRLWFWIGPTAHGVVIIISAFLYRPAIWLIYTLFLANIWMLVIWIIQVQVKKKIRQESPPTLETS
ncbi:MAG: CDP-alcohol phosphatidyltransferase family protein [Candidatus Cloacimonetes bacterium]|nr:CDP-alcohol phosphatidyltransferase family protein [Candidatus Cloacimonadota bacterium]